MRSVSKSDISTQEQDLLNAALQACDTSYSPYSQFNVGAAILSKQGKITTGSNVENAAYGSSICAERAAILRANAEGVRDIVKIAVVVKKTDGSRTKASAPCGACRQMIFESSKLAKEEIELILSNDDMTEIQLTNISELLPHAFGPADLSKHTQ